ncbi:MAG: nucleotide exchange factor GrpE [Thermoanaerobacteraceae bacterium]|nr:nucleotide exchange factor GrpE [Thermoanaerobacteraceae bacterium]
MQKDDKTIKNEEGIQDKEFKCEQGDKDVTETKQDASLEESNIEKELEELREKFKQKENEANEYLELVQRLKAEFENYRKRTQKEKCELIEFGQEKIILDILPVIDNFERALCSEGDDKTFREGIELIYKQFKGILEKSGVKEIHAEGEIFDPHKHHAVMQEEVEDKKENEIIEVLQKGYILNNKVIRPSMVKVAK